MEGGVRGGCPADEQRQAVRGGRKCARVGRQHLEHLVEDVAALQRIAAERAVRHEGASTAARVAAMPSTARSRGGSTSASVWRDSIKVACSVTACGLSGVGAAASTPADQALAATASGTASSSSRGPTASSTDRHAGGYTSMGCPAASRVAATDDASTAHSCSRGLAAATTKTPRRASAYDGDATQAGVRRSSGTPKGTMSCA